MHDKPSPRLALGCWLALALPLIAIGLWAQRAGLGFPRAWANWDVVAGFVVSGLVTLIARKRAIGRMSWPLAWLVYLLVLLLILAEAVSFYFQASTFNSRFFANLRLSNLGTGLHAFPGLFASVAVGLVVVLAVAAWWLRALSRSYETRSGWRVYWIPALLTLAIAAAWLPSPWQRLGRFIAQYQQFNAFAGRATADQLRILADPDPVPRNVVRAAPGKNLVIIYMESLERIYTDNNIFPGLTPNLNRWRAQGLDYAGYLTFAGADYTIAGLFSSQCGAPYLPSPVRALDLDGDNANVTSFQPTLTCLGDVLRAAGYQQIFMNGVDLSFADDGAFFRLHGFDQVLGLNQIEGIKGNRLSHPGWGLYDSDLFRLASHRFEKLAASGKPFNLDVLTIDNHPPHGRPSPGCPKYAANSNDVLQAVHCTDYLVGRFIDTISKSPAFKNTVVVVMSDHQSLRNDAWPLYPKSYKRRPLLFILNAGRGRRDMRFYHMDIAPTVLHLMNVKTNATWLAGADRSEANAPASPLVNDDADVAVIRHALWSRAQPLTLCKGGVLIGATDNGVILGGFSIPFSWRGQREVGLSSDNTWLVWVGSHSIRGAVLDDGADTSQASAGGVANEKTLLAHSTGESFRSVIKLKRALGESALVVTPLGGSDPLRQFSVDWIGKSGGRAHLANIPRLRNLEIASPNCASLLTRMDTLPVGKRLDLHADFKVTTAPLYPKLPPTLRFDSDKVLPFTREFGWVSPKVWGSFTQGDAASLGFTLPKQHCHASDLAFEVHPFIVASRPNLDVAVYANGALMTRWTFARASDHPGTWWRASTPVRTPDPECRVDLRFVFSRPGASPPPYPEDEDPRPLQLLFLSMQPVPKTPAMVAAH